MKLISLSQFKRNLKVGMTVIVENKLKNYTEERIVYKVRTNDFITLKESTQEDYQNDRFHKHQYITLNDKLYKQIYCDFPKAKNCIVEDRRLSFKAHKVVLSNGTTCIDPSNDFQEDEIWLKVTIPLIEAVKQH